MNNEELENEITRLFDERDFDFLTLKTELLVLLLRCTSASEWQYATNSISEKLEIKFN